MTDRGWLPQAHNSKKMNGNITSQAFKITRIHSKSADGKPQIDAVHHGFELAVGFRYFDQGSQTLSGLEGSLPVAGDVFVLCVQRG